jgi:hypothetical protein
MKAHFVNRSLSWILAGTLLGTTAGSTMAGSFTRGCAARDLQILLMIEDRQSTNAISEEQLNNALLSMLHARMICHEGHVVDALSMYDGIALSITTPFLSDRRR